MNKGTLLVIMAAVLWGTTGTAQFFAPEGSSPQSVGAMRLVIGSFALAILSVIGNKKLFAEMPLSAVLLAGFFVALYQITFFHGVSRTGVTVGTLVGIGSAPVFSGIINLFAYKSVPSNRWLLATMLAIAGSTVLLWGDDSARIDSLGIFLAMMAGCSYALYTFIIKGILPGRNALAVTSSVFLVGALFLLPVIITSDIKWFMTSRGFVVALHLGVIATALSYYLFSRGLQTVQPPTAVTLSLAEPMTASLLGIFLIGELLTQKIMIGIFMIFAALLLLSLPSKTKAT